MVIIFIILFSWNLFLGFLVDFTTEFPAPLSKIVLKAMAVEMNETRRARRITKAT